MFSPFLVEVIPSVQDFYGNGLVVLAVDGLVHGPHSAAANGGDDLEVSHMGQLKDGGSLLLFG